MSFQSHKSLVRRSVRNLRYFGWKPEACDCPIDYQVKNTVKAQKSMKGIVKIVHLPSVVQSEFYEVTRILFVQKENKNNNFYATIRLHVTVVQFWRESTEHKLRTLFCISRTTRTQLTSLPVFIQNILNCVPKTN